MHKNRKFQHTHNDTSSNSSGNGVSRNQLQQMQENKSGECTLCKRISVCICQRCGDFYCSPECQRRDWQSHRYICFPMPPLVKASLDPSVMDPEFPVLSTPVLNCEKQEKPKQFNTTPTQHPEQMPPRQQYQQPQQQNNTSKNSQVLPGNPPVSLLPANNSRVLITGFRSPNRVYVRSLSASENDGYMRVAKAIDAYGKIAPNLIKLPEVNSYAITHLDRDGIMYRVQILGVQNKNVRVLFSDYGNTAVRQLSELREISEDILRLQQHAVQVSLKGVDNYSRNEELTNFLANFEETEYKIQYNSEDERNKLVVLRSIQGNNILNNEILQFASHMHVFDKNNKNNSARSSGSKENGLEISDKGQEIPIGSNKGIRQANRNINKETKNTDVINNTKEIMKNGQTPIMRAPFATRMLKVNDENVDVLILDNSCLEVGYFGCIPKNDVKNLAKVHEYLENFKDDNVGYKPRINEYCIAKFEDAWYRAKVTAIPKKDQYTVLYVDYTNESNVESKDIRPYPLDLGIDCTTSLCLIHGKEIENRRRSVTVLLLRLPEDLSPSMVKSLQASLPFNKAIRITKVKEIDEQIVIVDLPDIIKML